MSIVDILGRSALGPTTTGHLPLISCVKHQTETLSGSNTYIFSNVNSATRCATDSVPFPVVCFMYTGVLNDATLFSVPENHHPPPFV